VEELDARSPSQASTIMIARAARQRHWLPGQVAAGQGFPVSTAAPPRAAPGQDVLAQMNLRTPAGSTAAALPSLHARVSCPGASEPDGHGILCNRFRGAIRDVSIGCRGICGLFKAAALN
jgi:hypothetical protein